MMKTQSIILTTLLGSTAVALAAPLEIGTQIGIDLGPAATPTANWNNFSANGGIAVGNVIDLGGTTVDGVAIDLAGGEFFNPGTDNWAGLASQGGSAPAEFVNTVTNGFAGASSPAPNTVTLTFTGLDPALGYAIHGVTFTVVSGTENRIDTLTVTGDRDYGSSGIRRGPSATPDESADGNFHHFPAVNPDSDGTVTVVLSDPAVGNPILCGLLIEATDPAPPPPPTGEPDQVWQIDFQGGPGGAFGSADPITATHDAGNGATWNAFQIAATNDKALDMPWPNPDHNAVTDPQLTGLLDGTGAATGVDLRITGKASAYNVGPTLARGGIDHAYGDHWFFGQQGNCTVNLDFEFGGLEPGLYQLTTVVNPNPHNPPRDLYFKIGGVRHEIIPVSSGGYAVAGTFDATIEGLEVGESGVIRGVIGTLESQLHDGTAAPLADPSLGAMVLRRVKSPRTNLAVNDRVTMPHGGAARIDLLQNDHPDGAVGDVTLLTLPASGTAVPQADRSVLYTHTDGTPEGDMFTYRFTDQTGQSNTATVTVTFSNEARITPEQSHLPLELRGGGDFTLEDAFLGRGGFNFAAPTSMAVIPGNNQRFFVAEKDGIIWEIPDISADPVTRRVFMDFTDPAWKTASGGELDRYTEMGVKSLAFHPNFTGGDPYVFVTYNFEQGAPSSAVGSVRVSRFTASGQTLDQVDMLSEVILIDLDSNSRDHNINGGAFGADGSYYVGFGDERNPNANAQTITNELWSSIIRIDVDRKPGNFEPNPAAFVMTDGNGQARYKIPADNPYAATSGTVSYNGISRAWDAVRSEIYVTGVRNPWRFTVDTLDGEPVIWHGDVGSGGGDSREEINILRKGDNAGWRIREGAAGNQTYTQGDGTVVDGPLIGRHYATPPAGVVLRDPEWFYARGSGIYQGASVIGGLYYRGANYSDLGETYVFAEAMNGDIYSLRRGETEGNPGIRRLAGLSGPVAFIEDPSNGDILILSFNSESGLSLVGDSAAQIGKVFRLKQNEDPDLLNVSPTLGGTGIFRDLATLAPNPGIHPYEPEVAFWSDHAIKRRWFGVPVSAGPMDFSRDEPWTYPTGSIFVKHFDLELRRGDPTSRKRIETRVLVKNDQGLSGMSYRWNDDDTEAILVGGAGESFDLRIDDDNDPATPDITQTWKIPSRTQCNICHTPAAGHVLAFNTRQLNRPGDLAGNTGNFLTLLADSGYLSGLEADPATLPAHVDIKDEARPLEARVRAYLDVNCAYCHRSDEPGGLNLRADASLAETFLIDHPDTGQITVSNPDLRRVAPGSPADSSVLQRVAAAPGFNRMPFLGSSQIDADAVALLTEWITSLGDRTNAQIVAEVLTGPGGPFEGQTDPAIVGFHADPDRDGIANGIEILLNRNPDVPDGGPFAEWRLVNESGADYVEVEVAIAAALADDLAWRVQFSSDLMAWHESTNPPVILGESEGMRAIAIRDDLAAPTRRFYRIAMIASE